MSEAPSFLVLCPACYAAAKGLGLIPEGLDNPVTLFVLYPQGTQGESGLGLQGRLPFCVVCEGVWEPLGSEV